MYSISIHAPLAGCDLLYGILHAVDREFQSTHPLRGATVQGDHGHGGGMISIHAPLAGCDHTTGRRTSCSTHFNPRTPCGVRPLTDPQQLQARKFQSTHPLRGATFTGGAIFLFAFKFQSTHPLRGATVKAFRRVRENGHFNPRTPCGVRLSISNCRGRYKRFQSTHPLRGATTKQ